MMALFTTSILLVSRNHPDHKQQCQLLYPSCCNFGPRCKQLISQSNTMTKLACQCIFPALFEVKAEVISTDPLPCQTLLSLQGVPHLLPGGLATDALPLRPHACDEWQSQWASFTKCITIARSCTSAGVLLGCRADQGFELGDHMDHLGPHHHQGIRLKSLRAHQVALQSNSPKFSSFTCTGLKWGEDNLYGCPLCRTCRFDNVCFNHSSQDIQYYTGDGQIPLFYDASSGQPHHQFPADFLNTGHLSMSPSPMDWAPKAVPGAVPQGAPFSDAPVVAYVSLNDAVFNFGHALFDFLFPVFNTLQVLDVYHPDFQLLLAAHQGESPHLVELFIDTAEKARSMLPLISRRPVLTRNALAAQSMASGQDGAGLTCFSSFVAGSGSLHTSMQRTRALPFRAAAFANLGIQEEGLRSSPRITMLKKKGKRLLENADSIMTHLQARFPTAEFETLEGEAIAVMSVKQQLEAMSRTDILITPCGGVGTVLTFLPPGATAIVMNYWHTTLLASVQMERNYYWNLEYLDIQFFPVLAEDYELTTDRPSCEKDADDPYLEGQGALIACNVYIKNNQRIEHVVASALRRWSTEHNRYDASDSW